ncbi:MAG TPA: hypothetical protein VMT37_02185 [Solirubrobacterales bacterium]|nr:hypothetical protein [Solirubrobacterales bacterium]
MKLRFAIVLGLFAALALPSASQAALPRTSTTLIVPGSSIGGLKLGAKLSQVTKAWGATKSCEYQCLYEGGKGKEETAALASVLLESKQPGAPGKVWLMSLNVGFKTVHGESVPNFRTPLTKFRTAKGIGLGSKVSEVQRAYPKAEKHVSTGGYGYFEIPGPKEIATDLTFNAEKRITTVAVESHHGG